MGEKRVRTVMAGKPDFDGIDRTVEPNLVQQIVQRVYTSMSLMCRS